MNSYFCEVIGMHYYILFRSIKKIKLKLNEQNMNCLKEIFLHPQQRNADYLNHLSLVKCS